MEQETRAMSTNVIDDIAALKAEAAKIDEAESALYRRSRELLVGKKAEITDEHYNGQPYGRSRKPLKGKVLTIAWVLRWGNSLGVGFQESNDGCKIEGVRVL